MRDRNRATLDATPSDEEQAAQGWHAEWHAGAGYGKCWCCCNACKQANPHHARAVAAALADIGARIRDSMLAARPPTPEDRGARVRGLARQDGRARELGVGKPRRLMPLRGDGDFRGVAAPPHP